VVLTSSQVEFFHQNGWLKTSPYSESQISDIQGWVGEVQAWDNDGDWIHHRELTDFGPKLCRTENFVPFHRHLRELLTEGYVPEAVGDLMGEAACLYKEKINYKLAGGAGFRPHQDAPAYPFIQNSISCMIAIDPSNVENGCLEVVSGQHHQLLDMDERGCIVDSWVKYHAWQVVEMEPGDVLMFHAYTPHRSGANTSGGDRRAMYPTYNALSEGNLRDSYYAEKLRIFRDTEHSIDSVRISLINDFEGRSV